MDLKTRILRWVTTTKWTWASASALLSLMAFDTSFHELLAQMGLGDGVMNFLVAGAKVILVIATALGFSPLRRPTDHTVALQERTKARDG